ncbi:MAG: substrate-binding domain-containing protein [Spirochaetales bacterium]|nr:substrate-binding domain-containing protein [Spirochaetales bacterium]
MKRFLIVMLVLISLSAMAFAGGQQDGGEDMIVIGLSQESLDHPFMVTQRDQIIESAKALPNVKVIATDGQGSVVNQVAGIEDMLTKGIDILLLQAGKAEGLKQELKKVHEKGIPFMFVGKPIHGTDAITMVSMDNYLIGTEIGEYVVEELKAKYGSVKGNVVVIEGIPGDETSVNRVGGFHEVIDTYSGIKVVAQQPADYRRPQAVSVMQNILQANPTGTLDVVFAANGEMALGAVQAVKDAGRLDEVIIIGLDGQQEELDAIAAGDMAATWTYEPCGTQGFELAMKILAGETVDLEVIPASRKITKENVAGQKPAF